MLGSNSDSLTRQRSQPNAPDLSLHNVRDQPSLGPPPPLHSEATTAIPSDRSSSTSTNHDAGTWGERDVGGHVSRADAMDDFDSMRREISHISRQQSRPRSAARRKSIASEKSKDLEAQEQEQESDDFDLAPFLKEGYFEKRHGEVSAKKVGVVYRNLTVTGAGATAVFVKTLPQAILGTFGPDLYHLLTGWFPFLKFGNRGQTRTLINDFSGVVRDGEMMLVLGRPGAGCSTFLKAIANQREGFAGVTGDVRYGSMTAANAKKNFRGEVVYNPEDDVHFPSLSVYQTLRFALLNKTKKHAKGEVPIIINALLKMFRISHTYSTLVGNAYVPGVSGGERKRVSIAETLATKSTVACWDNSTRGLDSSTALDYTNSLRIMTDISNRTTLVTLYQAGEGIYDLMDKVLLIDSGRMVYQGPAKEAKGYFEDLGYQCPDRQTTADFLTGITDPLERHFKPGMEHSVPKGAEELERAYKNSEIYKRVLEDVETYEKQLEQTDNIDAKNFAQSVRETKSRTVSKKSPYTVSFVQQVINCTRREFWLFWGDSTTLYSKFFTIVSNGLVVGSLFYGQTSATDSAFSRGGSLFFGLVFLGWLQLSELMKAVTGREVVARHKEYAFYRPSAVSIARVVTDFPVILLQVIPFALIMYFMCNLYVGAGQFWIYFLFVYVSTLCVTGLYRMFASLSPGIDDAVRFAGLSLNILVVYTGYVIPKTQLVNQKIWFGWLYYLNPIAYAFEAVMANEFDNRDMPCSPLQLVPSGPGIDPAYQGCAIAGASIGQTSVQGSTYISTSFGYTGSHLWRNFGVVIAFTVLYILITALCSELFSFVKGGGGALVFKKSKNSAKLVASGSPADEEKGSVSGDSSPAAKVSSAEDAEKPLERISQSESIFTWTDVNYSVPTPAGPKKLLNNVNGYAKPGVMVALMGVSGAGKTTLLNTLAQRSRMGVVTGDMRVDGHPLGPEFQRGTGFCEQMDLHDGSATIREALEFSAILRQERHIPRAEKLAYVEQVIDLLELSPIEDAVVSSLGVEQRKRLTIGVELAARPSLLLFLDEPTSGLDSQSAYNIIRFIKKLSAAGQAIICTIHQPSSVLIQQFDMILALNPGGNTFYYGEVGHNGATVLEYFRERGMDCPADKNPAEFILEIAAKGGRRPDGSKIDWNEEWRTSKGNKALVDEIRAIEANRSELPRPEQITLHEFASPVWLQITELTKRMFIQHWRDSGYLYGKIFVSVIIGIFNGFTFYNLGNSIQDMQNRMFSVFLIIMIPPTIVNGVLPKFYANRALWEYREQPSRIYGWAAFCTANIVAELPMAVLTSVIYWALWYFPTGLPRSSGPSGYTFLMTLLFFFFQASWGQWICAFAPSFTVISNLLPTFFVVFALFNGVVRPYNQLSVFWRYWLYYLNPSTYWIGGVLAATLDGIPVRCLDYEAAHFNPPPGQTCAAYAGDFVSKSTGYLINPSATADCAFCPYTSGNDYLRTLNINVDNKWRDFGIFLAFVISNWALVYFFIWSVRVKGYSFGMGPLFGLLGKGVNMVKGLFKRKQK
ncbi:MAG: hypothetical protein M1814_004372 [Vezdaea aestivalis]|nr:MAG: hypothetical protein M1814_004372 [Vezdaea aestivalis]